MATNKLAMCIRNKALIITPKSSDVSVPSSSSSSSFVEEQSSKPAFVDDSSSCTSTVGSTVFDTSPHHHPLVQLHLNNDSGASTGSSGEGHDEEHNCQPQPQPQPQSVSVDRCSSQHHCHSPLPHRQVSFGEVLVVERIENAPEHLDSKQKSIRWVSKDEYASIRLACLEDLHQVKNKGSQKKSDMYSYRGLEMCDPETIVRRQRHHMDTVNAVLLLQREKRHRERQQRNKLEATDAAATTTVTTAKQSNNQETFSKEIRKIYRKHMPVESMREALENAYIDRKAVEEYLSTTPSLSELSALQQQQQAAEVANKNRIRRSMKTMINIPFLLSSPSSVRKKSRTTY